MTSGRASAISSLSVVLAVMVFAQSARADDWPQWRGPKRDGVWRETGIISKFEGRRLKPAWSVPILGGYSGPTVADGRVFVTDRTTKPSQTERVLCFDEKTGKSLWTHQYDCVYSNVGYDTGPRASVSIDNGRAYSLGSMGHLFCLDAKSGAVLFKHDLNTEYGIRMPVWGIAASPLIEDDLLIVQIGGERNACVVAFDKNDGSERWRALGDEASYVAPIVIEQAGRRVLVVYTGQNVVGLDPKTGAVLWSHSFPPKRMVIGISTPVVHDNRLFLTNFFDGSLMLALDDTKPTVKELWRRGGEDEQNTDALHSIISTPYFAGDHIYGIDSYGELRCLEAKSGDRVWETLKTMPKARWATAHLIPNGDKVWIFTERGKLIIASLTPQGYEEISRTHLIDPTLGQLRRRGGVCWTHPAFANKHVFVRNDKELISVDLAAK